MKLTGEQPQDMAEQAFAVVEEYVRTFNKMRCIGMAEREEIYTALCDILASLPEGVLDSEALIGRFKEMRDFQSHLVPIALHNRECRICTE